MASIKEMDSQPDQQANKLIQAIKSSSMVSAFYDQKSSNKKTAKKKKKKKAMRSSREPEDNDYTKIEYLKNKVLESNAKNSASHMALLQKENQKLAKFIRVIQGQLNRNQMPDSSVRGSQRSEQESSLVDKRESEMQGCIETYRVEESGRHSNSRRMPNQLQIDHYNQQTIAVKTKQLILKESGRRSYDEEIKMEGSERIDLRRDAKKFPDHSTGDRLSIQHVWRNETDRKLLGSASDGVFQQLSPQQYWRNIRSAGDNRGCSAFNLTRQT